MILNTDGNDIQIERIGGNLRNLWTVSSRLNLVCTVISWSFLFMQTRAAVNDLHDLKQEDNSQCQVQPCKPQRGKDDVARVDPRRPAVDSAQKAVDQPRLA